ncbi:M1-specific T cell receptor beta chain-like [Gymnodraco acuticeps]|uniref:M1-specific T cell receptor beta chain-like n=1 Tax=Gymnodraco acuticeps TaxID=8218 RepID=UPI001471B44B|nr:M1-specific T cell receptor beta chain-like [Gymnodraco acuticeps]
MIRDILSISLLLLLLSCPSLSRGVLQDPSLILGSPDTPATISCSHSISSYNMILWYQQPTGHSHLNLIGYVYVTSQSIEDAFKGHFEVSGDGSVESELHVLKLRQPEDSAMYFCAASGLCANYQAYFGQGTKVTVLEPGHDVSAPTVTVFPPSAKECRNQRDRERKKTLVCVASGFYPDHVSVSWQVGGGAVSSGVATDSSALREDKDQTYRISSRLRVSASDWFTPDRKFTCSVSFFNGTHTSHHENTVEGVEGSQVAMTREKYLKTTQAAKLSYVVFIVKSSVYGAGVAFLLWRLQGSAGKQNN